MFCHLTVYSDLLFSNVRKIFVCRGIFKIKLNFASVLFDGNLQDLLIVVIRKGMKTLHKRYAVLAKEHANGAVHVKLHQRIVIQIHVHAMQQNVHVALEKPPKLSAQAKFR